MRRQPTTRTRVADSARRPTLALTLALVSLLAAVASGRVSRARQSGGEARGVKAASVSALPAKSKRYALVVGVDRYDDGQITPLGGASNDARSLADALVRYAGFPAEQVVLLASDQPAERQPTRGQILRRLSNLASLVPKDGLLLFSFAGHGMERGGRAYLLPSDAQVNGDVNLLEMTAVNAAQVTGWIQQTGVRQVLLLLDACRDDPASARSSADNRLTGAYLRAFDFDARNRGVEAFATLYATALGSRAYEYKEKKQGYFTWALVEGLKGGAADARGEVTLARLVNFVQERVPRQVALDLGADREQRPFAVVEGFKADELVVAVAHTVESRPLDAAGGGNVQPGDKASAAQAPGAPVFTPAKTLRSAAKSGRVLLLLQELFPSRVDPPRKHVSSNPPLPPTRAFWRGLESRLSSAGLNVTSPYDLSASDYRSLRDRFQRLMFGEREAGKTLGFALVIGGGVTVRALEPYQGLYAAEVGCIIRVTDGDTGKVIDQEVVRAVRGFGTTQAQADEGALAAASEKISAEFLERVASLAR